MCWYLLCILRTYLCVDTKSHPQTTHQFTALKRTDGHDLSAAFRSRDPKEAGPRRAVLLQHDVFMNATAYRSGCHKLLLGCPGGRALYLEPDHRLLRILHEGACLCMHICICSVYPYPVAD